MIPNRVGRLTAKLRRRIVQAERQGGEVSLKGIRRRCQGQGEAIGRVERNGADAMPMRSQERTMALGHFFLIGNWQIAICSFSISVILLELLGLAVVPHDSVSLGP
jgi:hypothetical protein